VTISVVKSNDVPSADPQPATISASASAKSVDLTVATVDSDTQFVALFINSLPAHGNLYYSSSSATSTKGGGDLYEGGRRPLRREEGRGELVFW